MNRLADRNLLTALVLLVIGGVFFLKSGSDSKDWGFPLLASYVVLAASAAFFVQVAVTAILKRAPDAIEGLRENREVVIDLAVFCAIILVYVLLLRKVGFWLDSFVMLVATSIYLTVDRTRRNVLLAVVVPLASCIVAYVVFLEIFYVPLPEGSWWEQ
jgi:hypothetical protein